MGIKEGLVYELHISGLSEEHIDITSAILGLLEVEAIEVLESGLVIYHSDQNFIDHVQSQLGTMATWLEADQLSRKERQNENWNKSWESSFDAIIIDDFCTVKATFHNIENKTKHSITIDPEMAFGTGHHETTYAMIQMMERLDFADKEVMDYGTGTAILAILAELLGAKHIFAFDYDEVATECAIRCVSLNNCNNITCDTAEIAQTDTTVQYDIILANINRHVLLTTAHEVYARQKSGGELLLSGILESDFNLVLDKYTSVGYQLDEKIQRGEWLCLRMSKVVG